MSNYPAWWDKTVTVYNKYVDHTTQRVTWYRTVIENCFWKYVNQTYFVGTRGISTSGIQLETKETICRIPQDDRYVDKRTWNELEDKTSNFTLANGDIVILGEVDDVIDEYVSGQRSTDVTARYKEYDACIEIDSYTINTYTGVELKHYKIVGK